MGAVFLYNTIIKGFDDDVLIFLYNTIIKYSNDNVLIFLYNTIIKYSNDNVLIFNILTIISEAIFFLYMNKKIVELLFITSTWWRYIVYLSTLVLLLILQSWPISSLSLNSKLDHRHLLLLVYGIFFCLMFLSDILLNNLHILNNLHKSYKNLRQKLIKNEKSDIKEKNPTHTPINPTRNPIDHKKSDLLNRDADVKNFYELLTGNDRAIGIVGSWGVGKTSFINLLRKYQKDANENSSQNKKNNEGNDSAKSSEDFIFVDYNLYHQEHIAGKDREYNHLYIFALFLQAVLKENRIYSDNIIVLFQELAKFSSLLSFTKKYGLDFTNDTLRNHDKINQDICKELASLLTKYNKCKIVVIYDDLDRLTDKSEIFELLKLIDILNDIKSPNIVQIIAYDNEKLLHYMCAGSAEEKEKEINEKFINRMIDYKFILRDRIDYPLMGFEDKTIKEAEQQIRLLCNESAEQCFKDIAKEVKSMPLREIIDFNCNVTRAIESILHYSGRTNIPNEYSNETSIKIYRIKFNLIHMSMQGDRQSVLQFMNIMILRLTQLLKTFSSGEYTKALDLFWRTNLTEIESKIEKEKFPNLDILKALVQFFKKVQSSSPVWNYYKRVVSYHFPELLDDELILLEKISKQFHEDSEKIDDELCGEIVKEAFLSNILDKLSIKDTESNRKTTWKKFKDASILLIEKKYFDDFLKMQDSVEKDKLLRKIYESLSKIGPHIHIISESLKKNEEFKKYVHESIQNNLYRAGFYELLLLLKSLPYGRIEEDAQLKEEVQKLIEKLYNTIINTDTTIITAKLEEDDGTLLYYMLYCFIVNLDANDDPKNKGEIKSLDKIDEKIAECIEKSKDEKKFQILANFLLVVNINLILDVRAGGIYGKETEEQYKESLGTILFYHHTHKNTNLIKDFGKFEQVRNLFRKEEYWKSIKAIYADNNKFLKLGESFYDKPATAALEDLKFWIDGKNHSNIQLK